MPNPPLLKSEIEVNDGYYERKFPVPLQDSTRTEAFLHHHFLPQPKFSTGINKTLYYDTPELKFFSQVLDGEQIKTKLRFREYQDPINGKSYALEVKQRDGLLVFKRRLRFDTVPRGWNGDLFTLLGHFDQHSVQKLFYGFQEDLHRLRPKIQISYRRHRLVSAYSNIRVNWDENITAEFLYRDGIRVDILKPFGGTVIEAKSRQSDHTDLTDLSYFSAWGLNPASFSKYGKLLGAYH